MSNTSRRISPTFLKLREKYAKEHKALDAMALTVLTNDDVNLLLHSLTKDDILELQKSLANSMHYYSVGDDEIPVNNSVTTSCASNYQPERISMTRKDGSTTLFMAGASTDGIGIKVVTVAEGKGVNLPMASLESVTETTRSSLSTVSLTGSNSPRNSFSTPSGSRTPSSLLTPLPTDSASTTGSISGRSGSSASIIPPTSPSGSLTLLDNVGRTRAILNASEVTAFRTALASTIIFNSRQNVHDVVIFGAGKQAYWHARLALLLRGPDVHHLNIINRSFDGARRMLSRLIGGEAGRQQYPVQITSIPKREIVTPAHGEYSRHLRNLIRASSVIFFTTPSTIPLFPHELLTNSEGRKKGRYLAAVGSYKPHMCEIPPEVIKQAVEPQHHAEGHRHFHRHPTQGGAIVVDSVDACLKEAGELIQAGIGGREVVELGELVMLKKEAHRRRADKQESTANSSTSESEGKGSGVKFGIKKKIGDKDKPKSREEAEDESLKDWLLRGNVIYKSVGLALMDCVIGHELVRIADAKGIGTRIANF